MVEVVNDEREAKEFVNEIVNLVEQYANEMDEGMREQLLEQMKRKIFGKGVVVLQELAKELASRGISQVEDMFGIQFGENFVDDEVLRRYFDNDHWKDIMNNYGEQIEGEIRNAINDSIIRLGNGRVRIDYRDLVDKMENVIGLAYTSAERLARSELHGVYNSALAEGYKYASESFGLKLRYKWWNPMDRRTSEICREIINRVGNGVNSIHELENIVEDVSNKYLGKYGWHYRRGSFLPHPNCRSRVIAIRINGD